ncbi:MAG: hypothetical protein E7037_02405 [Verrucomicrobia bacterium]|nr:hypothetical protein [Verrucomicrobiota bacterium]
MGWSSFKKSISKAVRDVGREARRAAKKAESTVRHFDSTDWAMAGVSFASMGSLGTDYMIYDHNKGGIKRMVGMDTEAPDVAPWTDTQNTLTNEGQSELGNDERRKRLAAQYSLKKTSAAKSGKVLGGTRGGPGTGGASIRKSGGSV